MPLIKLTPLDSLGLAGLRLLVRRFRLLRCLLALVGFLNLGKSESLLCSSWDQPLAPLSDDEWSFLDLDFNSLSTVILWYLDLDDLPSPCRLPVESLDVLVFEPSWIPSSIALSNNILVHIRRQLTANIFIEAEVCACDYCVVFVLVIDSSLRLSCRWLKIQKNHWKKYQF